MNTFMIVYLAIMGFGTFMYLIITFCESMTPIHEFNAWKVVRVRREKMYRLRNTSGFDKNLYIQICAKEKEYAQDFLLSVGYIVGIIIWPVTIVVAVIYGLWIVVKAIGIFFKNLPTVFSAARGQFKE